MARPTQAGDHRRNLERRTNPAIIPGLLALVLIVSAVVVAVLTRKPKDAPVVEATKPKPFADLPPEAEPPPRVRAQGSDLPMAPDSITAEPLWVQAQALAAEGKPHFDAAIAAKSKNDTSAARDHGKLAREKYNQAVELTAEWEESVLAKYNERDSKVREIKRERTDWFSKLQWLEKSVGH